MSNYIHSANQTLLWNTVNKIPEFQQLSSPKKDFEFKQIIEFFYRKNMHKPILTIQELQQLNRETILAFIPPSQPSKNPTHQSQFEERQNVYKQMSAKPDLPSVEIFKDNYDDSAIPVENMDALIHQYQKQREIEFNQLIPPNPISQVQVQVPVPIQPNSQVVKKPRIRIFEDISAGILEEDDINKKKVSFSLKTQEYSIDDFWEKKVSQLEERILLLEKQMMYLTTPKKEEEIIKEKEETLTTEEETLTKDEEFYNAYSKETTTK